MIRRIATALTTAGAVIFAAGCSSASLQPAASRSEGTSQTPSNDPMCQVYRAGLIPAAQQECMRQLGMEGCKMCLEGEGPYQPKVKQDGAR